MKKNHLKTKTHTFANNKHQNTRLYIKSPVNVGLSKEVSK